MTIKELVILQLQKHPNVYQTIEQIRRCVDGHPSKVQQALADLFEDDVVERVLVKSNRKRAGYAYCIKAG